MISSDAGTAAHVRPHHRCAEKTGELSIEEATQKIMARRAAGGRNGAQRTTAITGVRRLDMQTAGTGGAGGAVYVFATLQKLLFGLHAENILSRPTIRPASLARLSSSPRTDLSIGTNLMLAWWAACSACGAGCRAGAVPGAPHGHALAYLPAGAKAAAAVYCYLRHDAGC